MKHIIASFVLALGFSAAAYAACSTHTITSGGRMMTCTTCCYNGNCSTTCY